MSELEIPAGLVKVWLHVDPGKAGFGWTTGCYVSKEVADEARALIEGNNKG